jgi:anti-sigma factor RsiW
MTVSAACSHEESWMLLPWLVNGRLEPAERLRVEQHVRACDECTRELAQQRRVREAFTEPERVVYAPGPSFRKLLERIDGTAGVSRPQAPPADAARARRWRSAWRPPGLAWAASFVLAMAVATLATNVYRWSQPRYATHTDAVAARPQVVHVAFAPSLGTSDLEQLLRAAAARVVEGPDGTGVYGVAPLAGQASDDARSRAAAARALAARLRADPRVRWVQPQPEP